MTSTADINLGSRQQSSTATHDRTVWGDHSGSGLECDEYPFASTGEGSDKGDNRYSVRLIDGKDNRAGGGLLDAMYTINRVLDGDAFYVKITG